MKRPEVTLSNYEAVYDFYEEHNLDPRVAKFGYAALSLAFRPDIHAMPGAEEAIPDCFGGNKRVIVVSNHVNNMDQYHLAAMAKSYAPLHPLMDQVGTIIPSKPGLFRGGVYYWRRWFIDEAASVPAFRTKDQAPNGEPLDEVTRAMQRGAKARLIQLIGHKMDDGYHLAIFPEGERGGKIEGSVPEKINRLMPGIGDMYFAPEEDLERIILPVGLYYNRTGIQKVRKPLLVVGNPHREQFEKPTDLMDALPNILQAPLDHAVELAQAA